MAHVRTKQIRAPHAPEDANGQPKYVPKMASPAAAYVVIADILEKLEAAAPK